MKNFSVSKNSKSWRVISSYKDDHDSIEYEFTVKMTYQQAENFFKLQTAYPTDPVRGKLVLCSIVAEHSAIELVQK